MREVVQDIPAEHLCMCKFLKHGCFAQENPLDTLGPPDLLYDLEHQAECISLRLV